jgi:hypothetical protein
MENMLAAQQPQRMFILRLSCRPFVRPDSFDEVD